MLRDTQRQHKQRKTPSSATLRSKWGNSTPNAQHNQPSNTPAHYKRITLTDLCPEEKAKIGQLMTRMQRDKDLNQKLQHENKELRERMTLLELQLKEAQETLRENAKTEQLVQSYEKAIYELEIQVKQFRQHIVSKPEVKAEGCQSCAETTQQGVQEVPITANKAIQTVDQNKLQLEFNQSQGLKSDRSHKQQKTQKDEEPKDNLAEAPAFQYSNQKSQKGGSLSGRGQPPRPPRSVPASSHNNNILTYQQLHNDIEGNENSSDVQEQNVDHAQARQLARAWLNVKKSSIQRLKKGLKKSQGRVEKNKHNYTEEEQDYRSAEPDQDVDSSYERQYNQLLEVYQRLQKAQIQSANNNKYQKESNSSKKQSQKLTIQPNQYLNQLQKNSEKAARKQKQPTQNRNKKESSQHNNPLKTHPSLPSQSNEGIDEQVLNRLLKSNDFKASAVLKASTYSNSSKDGNNALASSSRRVQSGAAAKHEPQSQSKNHKSKLDYYDADLLDIINSIQN